MIMQQSLWKLPSPEPLHHQVAPPPQPQTVPVPPMGGTIEVPTCWADGDRRPASLERLARVLRGDTDIFRANNGEVIWFRIVGTRVEGDHVVMTLQRIPRIGKGWVDWQRERGETASDESDL